MNKRTSGCFHWRKSVCELQGWHTENQNLLLKVLGVSIHTIQIKAKFYSFKMCWKLCKKLKFSIHFIKYRQRFVKKSYSQATKLSFCAFIFMVWISTPNTFHVGPILSCQPWKFVRSSKHVSCRNTLCYSRNKIINAMYLLAN